MSDLSANLALPYLAPSQAQKHVTHNEALQILDTVVQLSVADRDRTEPPGSPATGDRHIVPAGATGAWAGRGTQLALWLGNAWTYLDPRPGWRAWVMAEDTEVVWTGSAWQVPPSSGLGTPATLGVNTSADIVNRLAVAGDATLLTHDGAGHQLKVNKSGTGDTASLLFQSGFSGRAEMGLAGSDGWSVKVSPDGASWTEALALDPVTGQASGAALQSGAMDATPGRLMTVGAFGLGGTSPLLSDISVTDDSIAPGLYHVNSTDTVGYPAELGAGGGTLLHTRRTGGAECQVLLADAAGLGIDRGLWSRHRTGGAWRGWTQTYDSGNILGLVAQTGGVPTGALIERGSNANGQYVKFADGTMICCHLVEITQAVSTASATLVYRTASAAPWTFPATFATAPIITAMPSGTSSIAVAAAPTTALVSFWFNSSVSVPSSTLRAYATAFGRWF